MRKSESKVNFDYPDTSYVKTGKGVSSIVLAERQCKIMPILVIFENSIT